ncbi:hypothetical protein AGMMS49992_10220 [Clostridia bacterium]|nr:hypothetical protein AGMMS49992_10220 [Clostridia bacterium]
MELHNSCNPVIEPRDGTDCGGVNMSGTKIYNARDLYCLLNGDNASDHYDIMANIAIVGDWTPIISAGYNQGDEVEPDYLPITLDGNGHTITGLNAALFASVCTGTQIQNLHLLGITRNPVQGRDSEDETPDGGFIQSGVATFINCSASGNIEVLADYVSVGGFVGASYTDSGSQWLSFKNCVNHVNVSAGGCVGGFVGYANLHWDGRELIVDNCANYGRITVPDWMHSQSLGGFFGCIEKMQQVTTNPEGGYSVNYGVIDARHKMIAGDEDKRSNEKNSIKERDSWLQVAGSYNVGGFVGDLNGIAINIKNFINNGKIINQADRQDTYPVSVNTGGVTGNANGDDLLEFDGCISNADVISEGSEDAFVGGITGIMYSDYAVFKNNYVSSIDIIGADSYNGAAAGLGAMSDSVTITAIDNVVAAKRIATGEFSVVGRLFNRDFTNEGDPTYVHGNYAISSVKLTGQVYAPNCGVSKQLQDETLKDEYDFVGTCGASIQFKGELIRHGADATEIPHMLILNSRNLEEVETFSWVTPVQASPTQQRIVAADIDFDPVTERPEHIPQGAKFICWSLDEAGKQCVTNVSQITSDVTVLFAQYQCSSTGFNYIEGPGCVFVGCPMGCKQTGLEACECEGLLSDNVLASLGEIVSSIAAGESGGADVIKAGAATLAVIKNPLAALVGSEKRQLIDGVYNIYKNIADMECVMLRKLCCSVRAVCNCGPGSLDPDCCLLPTGMQYAMEDVVSSIADVESASGGLMLESAYVIQDTVDSYTDVGELQDIMHGIQGLTCITSQIENTMADKLCMSLNAACGCSGPSGCVTEPMSDSISKVIESISDTEQGVGKLVQFGAEALETLDTTATSAQDVLDVMNSVGGLADSALAIEQASMRKLCTSLSILCPSENNPPLCPDVPLDCAGICMGVTGGCA